MNKSVNVATSVATIRSNSPQNLFVSVKTFNAEGRTVGERIVDMCHYNTRNWLSDHLWWATHNGHCTEVNLANQAEVDTYLEQGKLALAAKFNTESIVSPALLEHHPEAVAA